MVLYGHLKPISRGEFQSQYTTWLCVHSPQGLSILLGNLSLIECYISAGRVLFIIYTTLLGTTVFYYVNKSLRDCTKLLLCRLICRRILSHLFFLRKHVHVISFTSSRRALHIDLIACCCSEVKSKNLTIEWNLLQASGVVMPRTRISLNKFISTLNSVNRSVSRIQEIGMSSLSTISNFPPPVVSIATQVAAISALWLSVFRESS